MYHKINEMQKQLIFFRKRGRVFLGVVVLYTNHKLNHRDS